MKKLVSRTLILVMVLGFGVAAFATAEDGTWTGWVTETHCGAAGAKAAHAEFSRGPVHLHVFLSNLSV